jgi:C2 domain-containing protein 3
MQISFLFNFRSQQFPIICDEEFLKKVQNNHLELKLWEKTNDMNEKLIGSTKVPLHQFYIAFKDQIMVEHLSTNKLPIISNDSWCNFVSPLSNELFCQAKILLAIGSENQIDYLKLSRNLHNLPQLRKSTESHIQHHQPPLRIDDKSTRDCQIKNKLSAFIESLSQKLPEPTCGFSASQQKFASPLSSHSSTASNPHLRRTSDLLDSLQKALSQAPPLSSNIMPNLESHASPQEENTSQNYEDILSPISDFISMLITVDCANNLPKIVVKKSKNKRKSNGKGSGTHCLEYEPFVYATFEASTEHLSNRNVDENTQNTIKSHEGIVYCTKIISSTSPEWNESFDVKVPFDVLKNPQKKFVVKIWRKVSPNPTKIEPTPFEDAVVGFSAIDISALLTGLPILSGWFSIVDFSGRCNGQIKMSFKVCEDLNKFRNVNSPLVPLNCPLNINVGDTNDSASILSRTLKRKFTELDEITQRLKARLFDVTGDENFDPDDEFEKDLNTTVDEMEDEKFENEDFGWLKTSDNNIDSGAIAQNEVEKFLESQRARGSSSGTTIPSQRQISGCSSSDENQPALVFEEILKKYDLDSIINPNIFKNILDPTLANSDSTPTLNPIIDGTGRNSADSAETTVSSIISNDQVQTIQKALQKTSLSELNDQAQRRKDPDGQNNLS